MQGTKKILFGCLIFPLLVLLAFYIGYRSISKGMPSSISIPAGSWLVVNPGGLVEEYSEIRQSNLLNISSTSVEDICRKIDIAASDNRIKGLILRPRFAQMSYAGISELESAITIFKQSGKPVYAFGDMISQRDYLILSLADKIHIEPSASAGIMLDGVNAGITFYKEMFDKLGIKMHILQVGDYKGAGEPYSQTSLSSKTLENYRRALGARYELIIKQIADRRGISPDTIKAIFETREDYFISPKNALEIDLVDVIINRDAFYANYGIDTKQLISVSDYQDQIASRGSLNKVAVVYLNGSIAPGMDNGFGYDTNINAVKIQRIINAIRKDKSIKAVVLRISSGGGSALESELIYQKLMQLKTLVPVVVSMGGAAASGGYYISCASDYIFADEYTITGSIGVIMMVPEAEGLSRKVGLRNQNISFGKFAGSYDLMNRTDPALLNSFRRNATSVYDEFKSRILETRNIDPLKLEEAAQGKIWSARDAYVLGLIDEIGGLRSAIEKAGQLSGIEDYNTITLPGKISWFEAMRGSGSFRLQSLQSLLEGINDPQKAAQYYLEKHNTNEWLYLMPMELN